MIKTILLFTFVTMSFAFAQSPDTLYQDEFGNYYKVIYKTVENSVVESGDDANTEVQNQKPASVDLAYNSGVDSVAYYQNLISRYTASSRKLRRTGNILLGVGIPVTVIGLVVYTVGVINNTSNHYDDYDYYDDDYEDSDSFSELMMFSGYCMMSLGVAGISVSIPLKIIGSSKLRRAKTQQRNLDNYKARNNIAFTIFPGYNSVEKQTSINLALQF